MSPKPRYVFDNNAVVSALLFEQSVPGQAFYAALDSGEFLVSRATFAELAEVLGRKKFDRYLTHEERERFLATLLREALVVEITEEVRACRDPKDDKFLELVVSGGASCLVTGDEDLLALHPFRGVPVLTPAQFLGSLVEESEGGAGPTSTA
jgi:putative PIN family toxin of toxin-antitoxin system